MPVTVNTCKNIVVRVTDADISGLSGTALQNAINKKRKVTVESNVCYFN